MVAARAADLGSTWVVAGTDLRGERNPLHLAFGAGWPLLIAVSVLLLAMGIPAWLWADTARGRFLPKSRGADLNEFATRLFYGRKLPWWHLLWRFPPLPRLGWIMARYFPWALMTASFFAAAGNLSAVSGSGAGRIWWTLIGTPLAYWSTIGVVCLLVFGAWLPAERWALARSRRDRRGLPPDSRKA
jgi:hypothetical protein